MHKLFKSKNIMGAFYALIVSLPIFSILGRVLYTQWNPNSKDSYFGDTINQKEEKYTDYTQLLQNEEYYFRNPILEASTSTTQSAVYFDNITWISPSISFDITQANQFRIYVNSEGIPRVYFYNNNTAVGRTFDLDREQINFKFNFLGSNAVDNNVYILSHVQFYQFEYLPSTYLDNAFEYSLSTFIDENNFGKFNLFQWFDNMFLSNNQHNNLYIHFVNWYFNYFFYVSLGYILFLFIMWFVNFARRILEKSFNYDIGGY